MVDWEKLTKVRVTREGNWRDTEHMYGVLTRSDYEEDTLVSSHFSTIVALCPTREARDAAFRLLSLPDRLPQP